MDDPVAVDVTVDEDALLAVDKTKVLQLMKDMVDMLNSREVSTMESFTIINSLFLSVMGTVPMQHRWGARAQLITLLLKASVAQDSVMAHMPDQPEKMQ